MKHHAAGIRKLGCVLLALWLAAGALAPLAAAFSGDIGADIIAKTSQTAVDLEAEGIVLLKNEDDLLPLAGKKLNIFGSGSVSPFYGGAGSGAITSENPVSFYGALDAEGISCNAELRKIYEANDSQIRAPKTDSTQINNLLSLAFFQNTIKEMPVSKLTDKIMQNARAYSETALIMISRTSAEGKDHSADTLRLSGAEKALVEKVAAAFPQVVVLFNIGNIMEMGWLDDYDSIKAAAIIWIPGEFGMTAVARMLSGQVNPSGKLADTISYNIDDHPSSACFGDYAYNGGGNYVEYIEGIYVGYRYFETFAKERVQYPFGYGLSYTGFKQTLCSHSVSGGKVTLKAEVKNTGKTAGRDTVQVYYSAPYTKGGIEKSAIELGGFAKTKLLKPGEKQTVTVTFNINDMASYDQAGREAWVLEKGAYEIILGKDVRTHIDSFTYTNKKDVVISKDPVTGTEIKNLFGDVYSGFPVLSRANPEDLPEARNLTATDAVKNADKWPEPAKTGAVPKLGVRYDKAITLQDVYKDSNNDELWDRFLDQLTLQEMTMLVINGGYETHGVPRLGIPHTMDNDGPSSVKGRNGLLYTDSGTAYPCETAIACTWNFELAEQMGKSVGIEARDIGTDVWYAPGANIHRNPCGGRNFEYFSEDPLLSGKMASGIVGGAKAEGLVTTIKHFVLNDQEANRNGIFTWADEQAMREIYLKAFEIPLKETKAAGVMSGYNRLGTVWCGASSVLLNDLLRKEWGFVGFVVSDFSSNFTGTGYMSPVLAVYNGNDTILAGINLLVIPSHFLAVQVAYLRDPVGFGAALRVACKNICVMKMQSRAFLRPELTYDDSLLNALTTPDEWSFTFPYTVSVFRFALANVADAFLWFLRVLF
ncbi:MAG: glycoside hydrolase family 3 C-terminal domain-containing protein [Oscillospiraceae bacterium]|nr:glycoside hydrolase family 3 C-terminal domain-containing protein [Oscillospiraceae bacterium]